MKPTGPVEILVVKFPGNRFTGEMAPELSRLVESGTITIVDLLFIHKDNDGNVTSFELADLEGEDAQAYVDVVTGDLEDVLSEDDILHFAALLENNTSAGLLIFENSWAATFVQAMKNAHGEVILSERIPSDVIDQLIA
jgi:uncharacterized membrane protein